MTFQVGIRRLTIAGHEKRKHLEWSNSKCKLLHEGEEQTLINGEVLSFHIEIQIIFLILKGKNLNLITPLRILLIEKYNNPELIYMKSFFLLEN